MCFTFRESVFNSIGLNLEYNKFESLLVGLQCIVSCFMQQPALLDVQKVLLVNKIIQGAHENLNQLKSRLYLASFVLKTFDKFDIHAQMELIKPKAVSSIGIIDFILMGVSKVPLQDLKTPMWSKNSLYEQLLVCFGVMIHGLHGFSLKALLINLIQNLIVETSDDLEIFILDLFQILFQADQSRNISNNLANDLIFLLEKISTKSKAFHKLYKVIDLTGIKTFHASWMMYPSWDKISESELNACLILWSSPLCSFSNVENVVNHLDYTQKLWTAVCSEMDQTKDHVSLCKFYQVLGLLIECYIAILNSNFMSENHVRNRMDAISKDILKLILPLVNGGFQTLVNTTNLSMENCRFVLYIFNI